MSHKKTSSQKDKESSKTAITIAILGLLGTIITAYFTLRASSRSAEVIISATQTAEAKPVSPTPVTPAMELKDVLSIQFDYSDSPVNHGWYFVEGDQSIVVFEEIHDPTVGSALSISSPSSNFYAMDYELPPGVGEYASLLDVVVNYRDERTSIYAYARMKRNGGDAQAGWIKLKIGNDQPRPSQDGEKEWLLYVTPEDFLENNWVRIRVDMEKAVRDTFGRDGWTFDKLIKLRLRGNMGIDSITLYMNSIK